MLMSIILIHGVVVVVVVGGGLLYHSCVKVPLPCHRLGLMLPRRDEADLYPRKPTGFDYGGISLTLEINPQRVSRRDSEEGK